MSDKTYEGLGSSNPQNEMNKLMYEVWTKKKICICNSDLPDGIGFTRQGPNQHGLLSDGESDQFALP